MLNFIYYPVSAILWFWHKVFGVWLHLGATSGIAWALSVVFLVFTLRALLFKPFVGQVRSMRKMQEFAPEIKRLQKKYANDKQKLAQEMQKLQSEHGVNPLGGCLPVLVQVPVFIGLYHVLRSFNRPGWSYEANAHTANYFFSADEVKTFLDARLFGVPLSSYIIEPQQQLDAFGGHIDRFNVILVAIPLMIVASIATHFTARHSVARQTEAAMANPQTAIMNKLTVWVFPLGVLVGGAFLPIAILLYWLSNNGWTLGQQYVVYRTIDREEQEKKAVASEKRQALAPKPGQKPTAPKGGKRPESGKANPKTTTETAASDSGTTASTSSTSATSSNGRARAESGEVPGLTSGRARSKKQGRKRR
ncbi:membrane protein insertase YidC [Gandjariella thermophila]|uniref:Membrane protein insertase YidC n=1 Tax=Gandjariella thermophila TaxID=1931992 RepID=A0A4D4JAS9_9PSEU|nr:membrane protein insertase YidC [Gandjariella thermophila]GDY30933.1 membrane protein insertase YidC [Gandjariella thermophila]